MNVNMEPETCEQLLSQMVSFNTVNTPGSSTEQPLGQYLDSVARNWGFKTRILPVEGRAPNVLITHEVKSDGKWLMFDSHMDTVDVAGMTVDPFNTKTEDGKIFGRGTCDTKGTGAAMLWALREYAKGNTGSMNIAILFTVDEEIGGHGAKAFANEQCQTLDWEPIGIIVGEPTMMTPIVACNGAVRWQIHTRGIAVHSSDPSRGRSAISDMMRVVDAIETHYIPTIQAEHPFTGKAACSINIIRGGMQTNVIPDLCTIDIDRRLVPGEDGKKILPVVEKILDNLRHQHEGLQVEQAKPFIMNGLDPESGKNFSANVRQILERYGYDSTPLGARYGTNGNAYSATDISCLILGPGNIAQAHMKDEWLSLEQLESGIRGYHALMTEPPESWESSVN